MVQIAILVTLFTASLALVSPSIKHRLQAMIETQSLRQQWGSLGVRSPDLESFERNWGSGSAGISVLGEWMLNLEVDARSADEWRQAFTELSSAVNWKNQGFSISEARLWSDFSAFEAKRWREGAFSPEDAQSWRQIGVCDPGSARAWHAHGLMSPAKSEPWVKNKFEPSVAVNWVINGVESPLIAREWLEVGVAAGDYQEWAFASPSTAAPWIREGVSGEKARVWLEHDCDPETALAWTSAGIQPKQISSWKAWTTPDEARTWMDAGIGEGEIARSWSELRIPPILAKPWVDLNLLSPELAVTWIVAGKSPQDASQWVQVGIHAYSECEPWIKHQVLPNEAKVCREACIPIDVALRWKKIGFELDQSTVNLIASGSSPEELRDWLQIGLSMSDVIIERQYWTPEQFREWNFDAEWLGLTESSPGIGRQLSRFMSKDEAKHLVALGVPLTELPAWAGSSIGINEITDWFRIGVSDPVEADAWKESGFTPLEALDWQRVECNPVNAKRLRELKVTPTDWPSIREIMLLEDVDLDEGVWRYSIERFGYERVEGLPVFAPPLGNATQEEFDRFLKVASDSGCREVQISHGFPLLTREMLRIVPEARLQRASVRKLIWEATDTGRIEIAETFGSSEFERLQLPELSVSRQPWFGRQPSD